MPDCATINAEKAVYAASIAVDQASLTVAQNQLSADQTAYNYWLLLGYQQGCMAGMMANEEEVDHELIKHPPSEAWIRHLQRIADKSVENLMDLEAVLEEKKAALRALTERE